MPDDDRGRVGLGQAVAAGQGEPVGPGVFDGGRRVGVGTVRSELGAEVLGLGILAAGRVGVPGVGDDMRARRFELLQGGAGAVPAQHQRPGAGAVGGLAVHVCADEEERVVAGQGVAVAVQVSEGFLPLGGGPEREFAP